MMNTSPRLNLPYLVPAQAQKTVTHNEALQMLDALTQLSFVDINTNTPPAVPQDGDIYALGTGASGDWASQGPGTIAQWVGNAWVFYPPQEGWHGWNAGADQLVSYQSGVWTPVNSDPDMLGINATADAVNRLAVGSQASLFTHDGTGGHQVKINKATTPDDAGFVLQTDYVTHGLMGLFGNDDFTLKVSPDGSSFLNAFEADKGTGEVDFPQGLHLRGGDVLRTYEHGTWTPEFGAANTNPTGAQYSANGSYVRLGRLVVSNFEVVITNRGTGGAGNVQIQNLPFVSSGNFYSADLRHAGVAFPGSGAPMMRSSGTTVSLFSTDGADLLWTNLPPSSGFSLLGTFIYQSAD